MDTDEAVQQFLRSFDLVSPLEPHVAFFGVAPVLWPCMLWLERVRRNVMVMSRPCIPGSTRTTPTPSVIRRSSPNLTINRSTPILVWLWLWCFIPCYPYAVARNSPFLTFPLCCSCVQKQQAKPMLDRTHYCHHSDANRMLHGTWCTPELVQAVAQGYTIHRIHEVWHFPPEQLQTGLFAEYVNTWLKIKQE